MTCRICGICSVGHTTASVQATDDAFGVKLTPEALALRKLLLMAEEIQSHVLHVYFLAVARCLRRAQRHPAGRHASRRGETALKLKKIGNVICEAITGRHVHPISLVPGGFSYVPPRKALMKVKEYLDNCEEDIDITVDTVASIKDKFPKFERRARTSASPIPTSTPSTTATSCPPRPA